MLTTLLLLTGCAWITDDEWSARADIYDDTCEEIIWWLDADGDGYGGGSGLLRCTEPAGYTQAYGDCDDEDETSFPGGLELCDGRNNDCDDEVDEEALNSQLWFRDLDEDGFGNNNFSLKTCTQPGGYVAVGGDCDDGEASVNPDALEFCDTLDNDCDDEIDNDAVDAELWFTDGDGDGFGDDDSEVLSCEAPSNAIEIGGDCDDANSGINPDADEVCDDGIDNNCDRAVAAECATAGSIYLSSDERLRLDETGVGEVLAGVSDFSGDGLSDLLVGLPESGAGDGAAALVSGASEGAWEVITLFTGPDDALAGSAVAGAGDLNRDGYADLVIGGEGGDGRVWVINGGEALPGEVDLDDAAALIEGVGDGLGSMVSGTTDVDGDRYPELLLGADMYSVSDREGAVYLFAGPVEGVLGLESATATLVGPTEEARAGGSAAGVGDLNGDGLGDLLIGGRGAADRAGAAWVVFGPVAGTMDLSDAITLTGDEADGLAGSQVAPAGDTDGDGYSDVLVSAPRAEEGKVYLLRGPLDKDRSLADADATLYAMSEDSARLSLAALDFDNDGDWDLFVGDPAAGDAEDQGVVYGIYSPLEGGLQLRDADIRWQGERQGDRAGAALARIGDADGDGFAELLVGAPGLDMGAGGLWLLEVTGL